MGDSWGMGDEARPRSDRSEEAQAAFAMWVTGLVVLPAGLLLFIARRLLRRLRALGNGG